VVAVGRLVPVKRFELLIEALAQLKVRQPELRAVIVGEGYERPRLEALVAQLGASDWIELPGYVAEDALIALYRQAWVVASTSLREGWGMTVTEAGACATPSVVTRISGHEDAVVHGRSGLLVNDQAELVAALDTTLTDEVSRKRLGIGSQEHAEQFTWNATARATLAVLAAEALSRRGR
jgi:glycosyltransferase involved in cell wall biosynthesis